eukprot:TRINITY_DN6088_c0_g1_i1.p1 TRINITY_DN6088_c0_g1~~TRINITY_DN6088_c0_g1_i1.p1  ORF type:complete len:166 (+),score=28.76 TRINITY_DN6088_c0_g1_i1:211-708(+)
MDGLLDKISSLFGSHDTLPWTDAPMIAECEREAAGEGEWAPGTQDRSESIMRLAWALVHSRRSEDVQRGIAMLESFLTQKNVVPLQSREVLYLLAVGQYRAGEYARARRLVDQALQLAPDFRQAVVLKKIVEDKIAKDGVIGVGLAAAAVGLVASGVAAAFMRKK